jgi:hypothetical protein
MYEIIIPPLCLIGIASIVNAPDYELYFETKRITRHSLSHTVMQGTNNLIPMDEVVCSFERGTSPDL